MRDHQLGYFERFAPLGLVKRALPPLPIDGLYAMYVEPAAPAEAAKPPIVKRVKPKEPAAPAVAGRWRKDKPKLDGTYKTRIDGGIDVIHRIFKDGKFLSCIDNKSPLNDRDQGTIRWFDDGTHIPLPAGVWRTGTPNINGTYLIRFSDFEPEVERTFENGKFLNVLGDPYSETRHAYINWLDTGKPALQGWRTDKPKTNGEYEIRHPKWDAKGYGNFLNGKFLSMSGVAYANQAGIVWLGPYDPAVCPEGAVQ